MCQWNLISLRGAAPTQAAQCFLESVKNQGLDTDKVINYITTPNAVGGGGVDPISNFGNALKSRRKGPERWMVLEVEKQYRILSVKRGCWDKRIRDAKWEPDNISLTKLDASLAQTYREVCHH
jgi:hypothetical protein